MQSRHMKPARPALMEAIQRLPELEAGGEISTSAQSVATAKRLHEKLARHVAPVVGEAGFEAIFVRSVKITNPPSFACRSCGRRDLLKKCCTNSSSTSRSRSPPRWRPSPRR